MIMDVSSCKVFSSCCKWFELYSAGVYHTEILEKKRKKYPQTDAIYFISPSRRSVQKLIDDFSENASDSTKANPDTRS
jgi:hypothetical protein